MDSEFPIFKGAAILSNKPHFVFEIKLTKINCRVNKDGEYVEGDPDNIYQDTYNVTFAYHDDP